MSIDQNDLPTPSEVCLHGYVDCCECSEYNAPNPCPCGEYGDEVPHG